MFWDDFQSIKDATIVIKPSSSVSIQSYGNNKTPFWTLYWWVLCHLQLEESTELHKFIENQLKSLKTKSNAEIQIAITALHKMLENMPLTVEILTTFWDYFKDRLNNNFTEARKETLENLQILPEDHKAWYQDVSKETSNNIFKSYLQLINRHYAKSTKADKELQRFLTRLRMKINFKQLTDLGLYNTISLFLNIYVIKGKEDIARTFVNIIENGINQMGE